MALTNKQIAEVLFTPTEEGKARCAICSKAYAPGNGYTNRLIHAKTHEGFEAIAEEMFLTGESSRGEEAALAAAAGANAPRNRGRPLGSKNKDPSEPKVPKVKKRKNGDMADPGDASESVSSQLALFRKDLQAFQANLLANVQAIRSDVQVLQDDVQAMRSHIDELRNSDRRAKNRRIADRAAVDSRMLDVRLHRFIRMNRTFGGGITGGQYFQPPSIALGEEFPSHPFPSTLAEIDVMPRQQIHELAVMMNNDFGIVSGDNLGTCHNKVFRVVTDEL